jgi:aldehyde dehydrogenase (NAD+)
MYSYKQFYINGEWVDPVEPKSLDVINPATEEKMGEISMGNAQDVEKAVAAAKAAFESFSHTTPEERIALLEKIIAGYQARQAEISTAISQEMGAPMKLATTAQSGAGLAHFMFTLNILKDFQFEETKGSTLFRKEAAGVCGLITPWNWPINQIACKVAPALAAGCTMVLKPSEIAPFDAMILAEILHEAGVPAGVFNLVNGDGPGVGEAISGHPDIDMVSFTGSTRAGVAIAKNAADTVKRVTQELGGKSANILLEDADIEKWVAKGVGNCFGNSGQSCNSPTRMLVPESKMDIAIETAKAAAEKVKAGDPNAEDTVIGPVVSEAQYNKIQGLIEKGIAEGATLVAGGPGKPEGIDKGYYVKPTVFANVSNDMTIAREEIFGPVLSILPYKNEEDAIRIANDTCYGLSGYVASSDHQHAVDVASRLRTGNVHVNGAPPDFNGAFGGYKQSGNGREWGSHGFEEFLETKCIFGGATQ